MKVPLKLFVCEFITGGGIYREPLPISLVREGALMRNALLHDLSELPDIEVTITHDMRILLPVNVKEIAQKIITVNAEDDVWEVWSQCIADADAVWLIAPETGGVLSRLTEMVVGQGKRVLGCSPQAVNTASSKLATYKALQAAGINTIATYSMTDRLENDMGAWVAKRDDGAGCEDSGYFESVQALSDWIQGRGTTHIVQPYNNGIPASFCMLCKDGEAWLLSCNSQKISLKKNNNNLPGRFSYTGSVLNSMAKYWLDFERIAKETAMAIPGLSGYVGVDVLIDGDQIYVLEINPRLTTSYAGLHQAIGCNPARLVIDLLYNEQFELPPIARNIVEISLNNAS